MAAAIDKGALGVLVTAAAAALGEGGVDLSYGGLKRTLREAVDRDPIDALVVTVIGSGVLFYIAERDENPKVNSIWDALVFVSTCLNVGYADVFARTAAGKAIATALMMVGPAMAAAALSPPSTDAAAAPTPESVLIQRAIADKLDAILAELRAAGARANGR